MDTDDLSNEAYEGIILEAEKFNHDLTLRFGVLAKDCEDEEDYFKQAVELIDELRKVDEDELEWIFFGQVPDKKYLYSTLDKITNNIEQVKRIPKEQKHYEF